MIEQITAFEKLTPPT